MKNFRSIRDAELELGPLTVLVGPNASGKSNLVDALQFLVDSLEQGLGYSVRKRGGFGAVIPLATARTESARYQIGTEHRVQRL